MDRKTSTDDLVHRAAEGDSAAFGSLIGAHATQLTLFIHRHAKPVLGGDCSAEDLLQSVFLNAWQSLQRFDNRGPGAFYAWIVQIARHTISTRIRYVRAKRRGSVKQLEERTGAERGVPDDLAESMTSIASRAARKEQSARLIGAVGELPESRRRIFELSYVEGLSLSEVAERLAMPKTTVWEQLRSAIQSLRSVLGSSDHAGGTT